MTTTSPPVTPRRSLIPLWAVCAGGALVVASLFVGGTTGDVLTGIGAFSVVVAYLSVEWNHFRR